MLICIKVLLQMSWGVKHMINIIMFSCVFFQISSMKVQQKKVVKDQAYGTLTLTNIQVSFSLHRYETWKYELPMNVMQYCVKINSKQNYFKSALFCSFHC